ncbi:MAG: SDR family oxidoreductase [Bacteroidales bacterium]|nr:SDR family oxidoreductase [Bacteroidales bacterium]MBK9356714.1 SDR family oxidoreductase [Bacteroidales bacterium]
MLKLFSSRILVTGGAGFIGSNLIETLLKQDNTVVCLDNFSTGKRENIEPFLRHSAFTMIEGDIRNLDDCRKALTGVEYVLHQAALGSVPRSINDPITSNDVNIGGFVNMLVAARDAGTKRFVYAASSSTYGDHPALPKIEENIGRPLSPYAVTKYVNELYAGVFAELYGMEIIGLRYFNVFGKRQDPDGAYAAVIPKFIKSLIQGIPPVINGDGSHSRDFTYIDNVVQVNQLALLTTNPEALNTVYNVAYGENASLNELFGYLTGFLSGFDPKIAAIKPVYGPARKGDVLHSLASIDKARRLLGYNPEYSLRSGLEQAIQWYYEYLNRK